MVKKGLPGAKLFSEWADLIIGDGLAIWYSSRTVTQQVRVRVQHLGVLTSDWIIPYPHYLLL